MYLFLRVKKKSYFASAYLGEWQIFENFASTYLCEWQAVFIKIHYLSKTFKLIVPRDLTWNYVERLVGITESSLSHVQLKNGTVVGHVIRNMSSQLQLFIKYEGLLEMKVSGAGFTQRI